MSQNSNGIPVRSRWRNDNNDDRGNHTNIEEKEEEEKEEEKREEVSVVDEDVVSSHRDWSVHEELVHKTKQHALDRARSGPELSLGAPLAKTVIRRARTTETARESSHADDANRSRYNFNLYGDNEGGKKIRRRPEDFENKSGKIRQRHRDEAGKLVRDSSTNIVGPEQVRGHGDAVPIPIGQESNTDEFRDEYSEDDKAKPKSMRERGDQTPGSLFSTPSCGGLSANLDPALPPQHEARDGNESSRSVAPPGQARDDAPSVSTLGDANGEILDAEVHAAGITFVVTHDAKIVRRLSPWGEVPASSSPPPSSPPPSEQGCLVGSVFRTKRQRNISFVLTILVLAIVLGVAAFVGGSTGEETGHGAIDSATTDIGKIKNGSVTEAPITSVPTRSATNVPTALPTLAPTITDPTSAPSAEPPEHLKRRVVYEVSEQVSRSSPLPGAQEWFLKEKELPVLDVETPPLLEVEDRVRQRYIVGLMWFALNGTRWFRNDKFASSSGWLDSALHECLWEGVFCEEDAVISVLPSSNVRFNLRGEIPPELGLLASLQRIDWSGQLQLTGTMPTHLGRLKELSELNLFSCSLRGPIPKELGWCVKLQTIRLQANSLTGPIPSSFGQLPSLGELRLNNNELSGSLPTEWRQLGALRHLQLNNNQLTASLPAEWRQLGALTFLELSSNKLTGSLPVEWSEMQSLVRLLLSFNRLTGSLPVEWSKMPSLKDFSANSMNISGSIPSEYGNFSSLRNLRLGENQLRGTIPSELANAGKLQELTLSKNRLDGTIPSQLGDLPLLGHLFLDDNHLTGTIPPSLGNLGDRMKILDVSINQLTGPIPSDLGKWTHLIVFAVHDNSLNQTIPLELGHLRNAQEFHLQSNQLTGTIPPELSLPSNSYFDLSQNQLRGPIPESLGDMIPCVTLQLGENHLTGTLPSVLGRLSKLRQLNVAKNRLQGKLPLELANLSNLQQMWLADNDFTGPFPAEYGGLNQLIQLNLTNTSLTGDVPSGICDNNNKPLEVSVDCGEMGCTCCQPHCEDKSVVEVVVLP